jgi:hypothetical protein
LFSFRRELAKQASFLHQFTVGPHFFDLAGFQYGDLIVAFGNVQTVNHRDEGGVAF